jgi:hypothetical protein
VIVIKRFRADNIGERQASRAALASDVVWPICAMPDGWYAFVINQLKLPAPQ